MEFGDMKVSGKNVRLKFGDRETGLERATSGFYGIIVKRDHWAEKKNKTKSIMTEKDMPKMIPQTIKEQCNHWHRKF